MCSDACGLGLGFGGREGGLGAIRLLSAGLCGGGNGGAHPPPLLGLESGPWIGASILDRRWWVVLKGRRVVLFCNASALDCTDLVLQLES